MGEGCVSIVFKLVRRFKACKQAEGTYGTLICHAWEEIWEVEGSAVLDDAMERGPREKECDARGAEY